MNENVRPATPIARVVLDSFIGTSIEWYDYAEIAVRLSGIIPPRDSIKRLMRQRSLDTRAEEEPIDKEGRIT
jgi:hypothetical protein